LDEPKMAKILAGGYPERHGRGGAAIAAVWDVARALQAAENVRRVVEGGNDHGRFRVREANQYRPTLTQARPACLSWG
jgi:hypothetical protein